MGEGGLQRIAAVTSHFLDCCVSALLLRSFCLQSDMPVHAMPMETGALNEGGKEGKGQVQQERE